MKKAKLKIPINLVDKLAAWLIDNDINVVISWSTPEEFFTPAHLIVIITFKESQESNVLENWKQYLKPLN